LNGSFSFLFHNDHLIFDQGQGDFRIKKYIKRKATVSGDGIALTWTIKALERIGFEVIEEKEYIFRDSIPHIEISYPFWKLKFQDSERKFDSLYAMCRYIRNEKWEL
jgi:iron complex transport system ATP-binding protein